MLKQIKGSGLLCGSNGQRQLSLIKVVGVQIIYALSSKADLSTHWLDYAPLPTPTLPSFTAQFASHFALFLPGRTPFGCPSSHMMLLGGTFGHYRVRVCKAAELSSLLAGYATRCSSPGDFPICRRKCRFHLRRLWRRNSCERRLGILRVACSISLQRIYGHSSSSRGTGAQVALATATGPGQVSKVFTQHKDRLGSARLGSPRSGSFVSLINCLSIIISCSLTSPDTVRGSVTVSVTSTSSCSHRVRPRPRSRSRPRCR